jgi:tetratricopeptide (TPR) repeat protein
MMRQQIFHRAGLSSSALRVVLCLCIIAGIAIAQDVDLATRLRLAQSFEQAGEWERAATIYESLLETNPQSLVILDGLRRSYTELKQYDKAMSLVRGQLSTKPFDENLLATLGGLYDLAGQPQKADSTWHIIIRKDVKNANLYRLVAAQLIDHRQYDKAITIYQEGRSATGNNNLFIEELASLFAALHQYESATNEYVKIVRASPQQLNYVEARLASFTGSGEGRRAALAVIENEVATNPGEVSMHSLVGWLHMEGKEFDAALDQYRIIDRLTKSNGAELFQFGQRAAQEHAYRAAAKAFQEVVQGRPAPGILPYARLGYARAIEELSIENDSAGQYMGGPPAVVDRGQTVSETQPTYQRALTLYESLIAEYSNTEIAMQAMFRIGTIRFTRFFDLNGAAAALEKVKSMPFNPSLSTEAAFTLAEVQTARNDLRRAGDEYSRLLNAAPAQYRDRALFRLAELNYYQAKLDSATSLLQRISTNVNDDLTNDALELLYFVQENRPAGDKALTDFASADLLMRQRKYSEALALFQAVTVRYSTTSLVDDALMRIGELQLMLNHTDDALTVFHTVANDMPTSILRDRAQMRIGELYENKLKNKQKAIEAYEQVLVNFPNSLFVEEARKRIRALRGDSI